MENQKKKFTRLRKDSVVVVGAHNIMRENKDEKCKLKLIRKMRIMRQRWRRKTWS